MCDGVSSFSPREHDQFRELFGDDLRAVEETGTKLAYLRDVASVAHLDETQIFQMAQRMRLQARASAGLGMMLHYVA